MESSAKVAVHKAAKGQRGGEISSWEELKKRQCLTLPRHSGGREQVENGLDWDSSSPNEKQQ